MSNLRLEKLLEMLAAQPDDTFLQYALGMEYAGMGNSTEAENYWRKVLELDANHIAVHYQLAQLLINNSVAEPVEVTEATQLLEKGFALAKQKGDNKTMNEFKSLLDELIF